MASVLLAWELWHVQHKLASQGKTRWSLGLADVIDPTPWSAQNKWKNHPSSQLPLGRARVDLCVQWPTFSGTTQPTGIRHISPEVLMESGPVYQAEMKVMAMANRCYIVSPSSCSNKMSGWKISALNFPLGQERANPSVQYINSSKGAYRSSMCLTSSAAWQVQHRLTV